MCPTALAAPATAAVRRSLILAGGGIRVSYQAGALRALEEEGLAFAHGDGTSGGIMNLAMLLSGIEPREMCQRWRAVDVAETLRSAMTKNPHLRVFVAC